MQFVLASPRAKPCRTMREHGGGVAGRSSRQSRLINALTGRNALARTSHTPGRTQD